MIARAAEPNKVKMRRCITCGGDYVEGSEQIHTALKLFDDCCICVACVESYRTAGGPLAADAFAKPHAGKDLW